MRQFKTIIAVWLILIWSTVCFGASQQTSSSTAATIIDNAESLFNDSDNDLASASEMLVWLNNGMVDIVLRSHCLEDTESIDLATDTLEYSITSTYITVKSVYYTDASGTKKGLIKGSPMSVGNVEDVSEPVFWYDWGGKVGIYPTFTRTTETITVYYVTRPTAITSSDNVTTPAIYDLALTYWITAHALLKDRQTGRYAQMMGLYLQEMARIRGDINEQPAVVVK